MNWKKRKPFPRRHEDVQKRFRAGMDAAVFSKSTSTTRARVHARLGLPLRNGRFDGRTQRKSLCPCMIFKIAILFVHARAFANVYIRIIVGLDLV